MRPAIKKTLNIISYSLNLITVPFFIISIILAININSSDSRQERRLDKIKATVINEEKNMLPLQLQRFARVYNIEIDSMVLAKTVEPYKGYLVTHWDLDEQQDLTEEEYRANGYEAKFVRKTKVAYVVVKDIMWYLDASGNALDWQTDWTSAWRAVCKEHGVEDL